MRARTGPRAPPYPAPPLRHFPSVQTAFGDLENDLRSGAGTEVPRSPDGRYPPTVHHIFPWRMMIGGDWQGESGQGQAAQCRKERKTGAGLEGGNPLHESAGLVWQAWRPGDRLGTITKATATGTQAEKGNSS